jgi:transposase
MKIMMDHKEARRMAVIGQTLEGKFNNQQAAQLLGLSIRQVKRLKNKAKLEGLAAVLHGNRGKPPHNALPAAKQTSLSLFQAGRARRADRPRGATHLRTGLEGGICCFTWNIAVKA